MTRANTRIGALPMKRFFRLSTAILCFFIHTHAAFAQNVEEPYLDEADSNTRAKLSKDANFDSPRPSYAIPNADAPNPQPMQPAKAHLTPQNDVGASLESSSASNESDKSECFESFSYANAIMRAENAYVRRRYASVIDILTPVCAKIHCIDDTATIIEIELLMGVAYLEQGNTQTADSYFLNVLRSDPDHVVGSIITIPEQSSKRIEQLRAEHIDELNKLREQISPNTIIESLYVLVEKEHHPYWINFLPFGAGQFQMHHNAWGIVYLATQVTGIALTILGGGMVEYYRGDNFTYSPRNRARAQNWQNAQIVGIALLGASYIAGVIHALVIHEENTLIIHSPSQTRPDIASFTPFVLPDGGGLAYGTVF